MSDKTITLTCGAAKLLGLIINQPENYTKVSDILRAGNVAAAIESLLPDEPVFESKNPTAIDVKAMRERADTWSNALVTIPMPAKSLETSKLAVSKMIEKGKLGADKTVLSLLTALGFDEE
jgi:hypothetical protein